MPDTSKNNDKNQKSITYLPTLAEIFCDIVPPSSLNDPAYESSPFLYETFF